MDQKQKTIIAIRLLAGLLIVAGIIWFGFFVVLFVHFFGVPESFFYLMLSVCMSCFLAIPGFFGFYFGYQGLRRTDPVTVRRLLGTWCLFIALQMFSLLSEVFEPIQELNTRNIHGISMLISIIAAVTVYLFSSRYFLRRLGNPVPLRQSLSRFPIVLIALQVFAMIPPLLEEQLPYDIVKEPMIYGEYLLIGLALAVIVYWLGVWLFVEQKPAGDVKGKEE